MAGPHRATVVHVRSHYVVVAEGPDSHAWLDALPGDPVATERTIHHVTTYTLGGRSWRVLVPPRVTEAEIQLALIDAEPAAIAMVEVGR